MGSRLLIANERIRELEAICDGHLADKEKMNTELTKAMVDAERYRWLKSKFSSVGAPPVYWNCEDFEPGESNALIGETLDAAIDAMLAAASAGKTP